MKFHLVLVASSFAALAACSLPKLSGDDPDFSAGPGLGNDGGMPTGTTFSWPAPVVVGTAIWGGATGNADGQAGTGFLVQTYVPLTNTSAGAVSVTLPGGLLVVSVTGETQNGLFIQDEVIVLPPQTTTYWIFDFMCVNAHRAGSSEDQQYTIGPVTDHPALVELVTLVENKDVAQDMTVVQMAVWEITDENGELSATTRAQLEALPDLP